MKSPRITYLITRVHGLKTHLITREDLLAMIKTKDLKEVVDLLLKTEYAEKTSVLPEKDLDASTLEKIFQRKLVERVFFLLTITPPKLREILVEYYRRFEIENIKRILRSKHSGEPIEEGNLIPLERAQTQVNFPALLAAKDVKEVTDLLRETIYSNISKEIEHYTAFKTPLVLEVYLDDLYYNRLWRKLKELANRDILRFFITEIDLKNLLLILGMKIRNVEGGFIENSIISVGEGLNKRKLTILVKEKVEDSPEIIRISPYKKILSEAVDLYHKGLFNELENLFELHRYLIITKYFSRKQFDIGYAFLYVYLCEAEAKNLITISLSKELGMNEEQLKKYVLIS